MTIAGAVYSAAEAILRQIIFMKEYIQDLEDTCEAEGISMEELFDQFDSLLDDQVDREFFAALRTYYRSQQR